ncbi:hypothetical protein LuPra_03285 [Luteitalea pratensis]|uniref:DUF218 domain-containing protein n=1 Tax=Luteitalea pratensis TaxID=1855912 RepID=A0A143PN46_LUTPR|nr:YdcF family protein [Luteitalea pratensis]AMY10057.1 hypothetical protein LuPra_03285 [Luteitalea pratensis]
MTLVALVAGSPAPSWWLIREAPLDYPDAILSLTSHERERFQETASQARQWPAATVLLAIPRVIGKYNCDACPYRIGWLESLGVPRSRIVVLTPPTENTREEIRVAAKWLEDRRLTRLLLVTSPHHTRRVRVLAAAYAGRLRLGTVACPVAGGVPTLWWTRHYDRFYVTYELAALAAGWWRHGEPPWLDYATPGRISADPRR